MNFYLAARYSRRDELQGCLAELETRGHVVTSRWVREDHLITEQDVLDRPWLGAACAREDFDDVAAADAVLVFTEQPRTAPSRGGRHVELGLALAWDKRIAIVGPRENIFHTFDHVRRFATWPIALLHIDAGLWPRPLVLEASA